MTSIGNTKISFNQLVLKTLYYRYRTFIAPVSTIIVCIALFWLVIIPQMQAFFAQREALATDTQNLATLHQNLTTVTRLDTTKLNQTLATATKALPTEKDFAGILSALNGAELGAGVILDDYAIQLGDLSGLDQNGKLSQLPIQLHVSIQGNADAARRFVEQLKAQLPLSDVISVVASSGNAISVTIIFYYAPLPKIAFDDSAPLPVLTTADGKMLETLGQPIAGDYGAASRSAALTPTITVAPTTTPTPTQIPTPTTSVATGSAR